MKSENLRETRINTAFPGIRKPGGSSLPGSSQLGYKDSNLEMTESESVALPFGDSPSTINDYIGYSFLLQAFLLIFFIFLNFFTAKAQKGTFAVQKTASE